MTHILYHPESFNDRFLSELDLVCSFQLPKMTLDISTPQITDPIRSIDQHTDHTLQVIFLSRDRMAEIMERIRGLLTFYRIFVFSTENETDFLQMDLEIFKFIIDRNSSCLLLIHNRSNGIINVNRVPNTFNTTLESVEWPTDTSDAEKDLFDSTLGDKAGNRLYAVSFVEAGVCSSELIQLQLEKTKFLGNLYFEHFNLNYIDVISVPCNKSETNVNHTAVRLIPRPFYKELSDNFEHIVITAQ